MAASRDPRPEPSSDTSGDAPPARTLMPDDVACPACGARMAYEGHCKLRCTRPCGFFMGCSEGW
ncbi:MAG TPA: hypothetical protein VFM29_05335 [Vicinamibacteria bacterium]|nr:hypothetical protein [Vicinamibacteria bacterium]